MKMKQKWNRFLALVLTLALCLSGLPATELQVKAAGKTYTRVTSASDITDGGQFILVAENEGEYKALGTTLGSKIDPIAVTVSDGTISGDDLPVWNVTKSGEGVSLSNGSKYLGYGTSGTNFTQPAEAYEWQVSGTDTFRFTASGASTRCIAYSVSQAKFGAYSNTNTSGYVFDLLVFKESGTSGGGGSTETDITTLTPTASPATGLTAGTAVTFSCGTLTGVSYELSTDGTTWAAIANPYTIPDGSAGNYTVSVRGVLDGKYSQSLTLSYQIEEQGGTETVSTIAEARAAAVNTENITVQGTVIFIEGKNVYVQDSTGGIDLFFGTAPTDLAIGDVVKATGKRAAYKGLEELSGVTVYEKTGTAALPSKTVTIADILADQETGALESTRVYIEGAVIGAVNTSGNTTLTQGENSINIYKCPALTDIAEGDTVNVYAIISDFNGYQLRVSKAEDVTKADPGFQDGSYVIWAPAYNKALSSNYGSSFYNPGVNVTETDGVLSGYGSTEIWQVTSNGDAENTYTISCSAGKLSMGASYSSMPLNDVNDKWVLEDAGNGLYYVKNTGRSCYVEWFNSKNYWSGYNKIGAGSEGMFALKFTPAEQTYATDSSIVENIAQWGGGGPYDETKHAAAIPGDKYVSGDMMDSTAQFTILANGAAGKPFQTSVSSSTGGTNYYMGGENIGQAAGDYMQFAVSTAGYGDMTLSFRLRATKAAPGSFQLQYSTDEGKTFQNFTSGEYSYAYTKYTSSGSSTVTGEGKITDGIAKPSLAAANYVNFSFDVPEGAENAEKLLIRLAAGSERADGGTGPVSGNIRMDTVVLKGSPIVDDSITGYVTVDPDGEEDQAVDTELTMTSATEGAVISYRFVDTATGAGEWKTYAAEAKPTLEALPATLEVKASCDGKADSITRILNYAAGTTAPVKMTPNGGGIYISGESAEVTLACETEGATIWYLRDEAEAYTEYTGPITLEKGFGKTVIKAYAAKEGFKDSNVVSRTFTERDSDTYNIYFGQLHAHTSYSDGAGTAAEAYDHASKVKNLDFLALTDHSNSFDNADSASISDGSMSTEWVEGHELAENYTTEDFVGLFGYEMTWSNGLGHMNTFNTPGFQSRTQAAYSTYSTALQNYYDTVKTQPDSINQFNHPGTTFGDFSDFAYYDEEIDQLITIIEVGNGEGAIGSSGYFPSYEYYTRALDKGWHVAPTNNQDNHKGLWGDANTGRSVVLADSLSEEDIYDAMRNYRVYATEDNDLSIMYTLDDNLMGTIMDKSDVSETAKIQVVLNDPTDDVIGKVEVIVNGGLSIAQKTVDSSSDTVTFEVPTSYSYYYIKVTEKDGDIAVTAPVWVGSVEAVGISSFTTDAALAVQGEEMNLTLDLYNNEKSPLEIDEITFTIDDEVVHTVKKEDLPEVAKMSTASYTFPFTYNGIGKTEIYANVKGTLNGTEKVYKEVLKLTFVKPDMVTRVIVDGTHYNDYVTGYYGGNMNNFTTIAAESQVEVKVVKDQITADMLKDCSLLVISAPARAAGTANAGAYVAKPFEDTFIAMVADYVKGGGSVVVCGLADYQDKKASSADGHAAAQLNKLLTAIGSTMRINDDEAWDDENNGGQEYRLYPTSFNTDSKWTAGIQDGQKYSQYSGCTVDISGGAGTEAKEPQWIVRGFDTTYSKDTDGDGGGIAKGEAVFLASQETNYGGTIFAAGGVFLSDFEVKAEMDNIWDLPYANRTIAENILGAVRVELPLSTIADLRAGNMGDVFRIQGYTTSSRKEGNAFFDALYLQDDTAGVTVFPIGEDGLEIGVKMEIIGYVDAYQGDKEIQVMSYKILDEEPYVYEPEKMSCKDAMDYEKNGGSLIRVDGEVTEVEYGTDGKSVNQFVVKDESGALAKVFIDGYILSSKTGKNELASIVKVGEKVSAVGLLYMHPEGNAEESVAVLRVRDCEEIKKYDKYEKLNVEIISFGNVPEVTVDKEALVEAVLTPEEIEMALKEGGIDIRLEIKDGSGTITKEAADAIAKASKGYETGCYLDITLYKVLGNEEVAPVTKTSKPIAITVAIPQELKNTDSSVKRTYAIVRYHNGKAERLQTTYDAAAFTLTFKTDKFSDYAIVYKDTKIKKPNNTGNSGGSSSSSTKVAGTNTGDSSNITLWLLILLAAAAGIAWILVKRKKQHNENE